jgi:protein SCO1/2
MNARLAPWLVLAALAAAGISAASSADRPEALETVDYVQHPGAALPLAARFRDDDGVERPLGAFFRDRPVVLVPAYYRCPMLCSLVLGGLARSLRTLDGAPLEVVVFSIDPTETPALAAEKKAALGEDAARWHLLTGDEARIRDLAETIGFGYAWDEARGQWAHPAGIVVATPDGRISRYLFGVEYAPRDLRLALVEASAGRLGTLVDRLLLFCYAYDPSAGAYSLAVLRTVRVAGLLTVALLAGFITLSVRRTA